MSIGASKRDAAFIIFSQTPKKPEVGRDFSKYLIIFSLAATGCGSGSAELTFRDDDTGASTEPMQTLASLTVVGDQDTVADRVLGASDTPIFHWSALTGAAQYRLTVFENDETTVKCATQNTPALTLTFSSCVLDDMTTYKVHLRAFTAQSVEIPLTLSFFAFNVRKLRWSPRDSSVFAGETLQLAVSHGVSPYQVVDGGSGFLNTSTYLYSAPVGAAPRLENVVVQDANGNTHQTSVRTLGFADGGILAAREIRDAVATSSGALFAGGFQVSGAGDEEWVILKSSDEGATWSAVDSHVSVGEDLRVEGLGVDSAGAIYAAGLAKLGANPLEVVVRKSTNGGTSWSTVDSHAVAGGGVHTVKGFAVASNGAGYVLIETTVGATPVRRLRKSGAGGAGWSDAADFPVDVAASAVSFRSLLVDSSGNIWVGLSEEIGGFAGLSLYRSSDGGTTWSRRLRLDGESQLGRLRELGGAIAAPGSFGMYQSANFGTSWSHVALPAGWTQLTDISRSSTGRTLATDGRHVALLKLDGGSWSAVDDIQLTGRTTPTLGIFAPCGGDSICLTHSHDASGWVHRLRRLQIVHD